LAGHEPAAMENTEKFCKTRVVVYKLVVEKHPLKPNFAVWRKWHDLQQIVSLNLPNTHKNAQNCNAEFQEGTPWDLLQASWLPISNKHIELPTKGPMQFGLNELTPTISTPNIGTSCHDKLRKKTDTRQPSIPRRMLSQTVARFNKADQWKCRPAARATECNTRLNHHRVS